MCIVIRLSNFCFTHCPKQKSLLNFQKLHHNLSLTVFPLSIPQTYTGGVSPVLTGGVTITTSHPHISTSSQQTRPPALGSGHSLHSRSSSNSSISSTALSQDSAHLPHPHSVSMATVVPHSLTNSGQGHHPVVGVPASSAYETSTATPATSSGSTPSAQAHSQGECGLTFHSKRFVKNFPSAAFILNCFFNTYSY